MTIHMCTDTLLVPKMKRRTMGCTMKMNDDNAPTHTSAFMSHCGVILMKPSAANQNGGIVSKEAPLDLSNVMVLVDGQPTRVGFKVEGDKKVRYAKKTGKTID